MKRHVCLFTKGNTDTITLCRVTKSDTDKLEIEEIVTLDRTHKKAAAMILLENAQDNILIDNLVITNPDDFYKLAVCKEKEYWCESCYKWYITDCAKCGNCGWEFLTSVEER